MLDVRGRRGPEAFIEPEGEAVLGRGRLGVDEEGFVQDIVWRLPFVVDGLGLLLAATLARIGVHEVDPVASSRLDVEDEIRQVLQTEVREERRALDAAHAGDAEEAERARRGARGQGESR